MAVSGGRLHSLCSHLHTILECKARTNTQSQDTESLLTLNPFMTEKKSILLDFSDSQWPYQSHKATSYIQICQWFIFLFELCIDVWLVCVCFEQRWIQAILTSLWSTSASSLWLLSSVVIYSLSRCHFAPPIGVRCRYIVYLFIARNHSNGIFHACSHTFSIVHLCIKYVLVKEGQVLWYSRLIIKATANTYMATEPKESFKVRPCLKIMCKTGLGRQRSGGALA